MPLSFLSVMNILISTLNWSITEKHLEHFETILNTAGREKEIHTNQWMLTPKLWLWYSKCCRRSVVIVREILTSTNRCIVNLLIHRSIASTFTVIVLHKTRLLKLKTANIKFNPNKCGIMFQLSPWVYNKH